MSGVEIERKYIIEKPSAEDMSAMEGYLSSRITQIYLTSRRGVTHRVRRREYSDGRTEYTETKKIRINKLSAIEDESEITRDVYDDLSKNIREGSAPVEKIRHVFKYKGKLIEIDEYPFWNRSCILETELSSESEFVALPPFIKVINEVTGDHAYSNSSMASRFPDEPV